jgi:hypothetical protein
MSREKAFLILAILVCLVSFAVYGLYPNRKDIPKIPGGDTQNAFIENYGQILDLDKDIDGNGQPAWRELVFGANASSTDNSSTDNLTVGMARDIVVLNALASQNPNVDPDVYVAAMTDGAAQQISIKDVGQIQISPDNSRANLKEYGNNAAVIFGAFFGNEQKEIKDVTKYMNSNSVADLKAIRSYQSEVNLVCDNMKTYPAPKSIATLHRTLLERCYFYNDVLSAMWNIDTDPTKALVAVTVYKDMVTAETELLTSFSDFFDSNNVVFGANDYGRIFNKKI